MLKQVLTNLIGNALKFVESGVEPRIRISAEQRKHQVRILVEDNGIGIPSQYHETIFGIFHQLEPGRFPGTGIGLAIVRKAMERMGGTSGMESMPGKGSRFWIELPRAPEEYGSPLHRALGGRQSGRPADLGAGLPQSGAAERS
jgi:signal transduction histidine kinase